MRNAYKWAIGFVCLVAAGQLLSWKDKRTQLEQEAKRAAIASEFSAILSDKSLSDAAKIERINGSISKSPLHKAAYAQGSFPALDGMVLDYYRKPWNRLSPLSPQLLRPIFAEKCAAMTAEVKRSKSTTFTATDVLEFGVFQSFIRSTLPSEEFDVVLACERSMRAQLAANIEASKPVAQKIGEAAAQVKSRASDAVAEGLAPLQKTYDEFWVGYASQD